MSVLEVSSSAYLCEPWLLDFVKLRTRSYYLQVETGSAITWKYPSVILKGDDTIGEFYSVALTNHYQQADTGTKMLHIGKNSRSRIISKGISAGNSRNVYRGQVQIQPTATGARNFSQCDSMLIGDTAGANTYPYIQVLFSPQTLVWGSSSRFYAWVADSTRSFSECCFCTLSTVI